MPIVLSQNLITYHNKGKHKVSSLLTTASLTVLYKFRENLAISVLLNEMSNAVYLKYLLNYYFLISSSDFYRLHCQLVE